MGVVADDVRSAAGPIQLCCGQDAGCEAAVHAMREVFEADTSDGVLLVDASNAFNNLNRQVALYNIQFTCPAMAKILINCYRKSSSLFVGGKVLLSREGTTQGDPLAMVMFGLATVPLIQRVRTANTVQCWFADDAASGGRLHSLLKWWHLLETIGPQYGYFPNEIKTYLVVKPDKEDQARKVFHGTDVQITSAGKNYLGGALGTEAFEAKFMVNKIAQWSSEIEKLSQFAQSQPQAAYAAFIHGLINRWTYAVRVCSRLPEGAMESMEERISQRLIPNLTGQPAPNATIRKLLALPPRLGGLGLINPETLNCSTSKVICEPLIKLIHEQQGDVRVVQQLQIKLKQRSKIEHQNEQTALAQQINSDLPLGMQRCINAAQEKGVSSWLSALPLTKHGFVLHKGDFRDALAIRYNWPLLRCPQYCACGQNFSIDHALTCRCGGYIGRRHDQVRNFTAELLREVVTNVSTEPHLQQLSGEQLRHRANTDDSARLDIKASGFWSESTDAFFDVRVVHPFASSYTGLSMNSIYRQHEQRKRVEYGQRIREIERGTFTPLVFTTMGGMAGEATVFYKRLASLLADKRDEPYSVIMGWLRCTLSFLLLRAAIMCVRGTRTHKAQEASENGFSEAVATCHIPLN